MARLWSLNSEWDRLLSNGELIHAQSEQHHPHFSLDRGSGQLVVCEAPSQVAQAVRICSFISSGRWDINNGAGDLCALRRCVLELEWVGVVG